jgi:hypothetical protein
MNDVYDVSYFRTFGFLVLPQFFKPGPLAEEIDQVMRDGLINSSDVTHYAEIRFQYVPMMSATTPASLALLDQTAAVASTLLGSAVIPTRAKGTRYFGDTPWHVDSDLPLESIGFAAYLEPAAPDSGALRVLPGSHRPEFAQALRELGVVGMPATAIPSSPVATQPGDVIVFDEHLFHSSFGGGVRRQWRIDFLRHPIDADADHLTREYFRRLYPPDWDGGYDAEQYPSYSDQWRNSGRAAVAALGQLGVYDLAATQEAVAASKRGMS